MSNKSFSPSTLLTVTAVIELGAGLALLWFPSVTVALLVGARLETPEALTVARVAGVALLTLGVACWLARGDTRSRAARGLVAAMVLYNSGVALILAMAGFCSHLVGVALWPAVVLHIAMAVWCIVSISSGKAVATRSPAG
jgi:Ca2+/Na+ antiporter